MCRPKPQIWKIPSERREAAKFRCHGLTFNLLMWYITLCIHIWFHFPVFYFYVAHPKYSIHLQLYTHINTYPVYWLYIYIRHHIPNFSNTFKTIHSVHLQILFILQNRKVEENISQPSRGSLSSQRSQTHQTTRLRRRSGKGTLLSVIGHSWKQHRFI